MSVYTNTGVLRYIPPNSPSKPESVEKPCQKVPSVSTDTPKTAHQIITHLHGLRMRSMGQLGRCPPILPHCLHGAVLISKTSATPLSMAEFIFAMLVTSARALALTEVGLVDVAECIVRRIILGTDVDGT